jgi:hypothetical protein
VRVTGRHGPTDGRHQLSQPHPPLPQEVRQYLRYEFLANKKCTTRERCLCVHAFKSLKTLIAFNYKGNACASVQQNSLNSLFVSILNVRYKIKLCSLFSRYNCICSKVACFYTSMLGDPVDLCTVRLIISHIILSLLFQM